MGKKTPQFEHPNLWKTKAEMLAEVIKYYENEKDLTKHIRSAYSCARRTDLNRRYGGGREISCGICPNCLLRRLALVNAKLDNIHEQERYLWKYLEHSEPMKMIPKEFLFNREQTSISPRDLEIAKSAIIAHRDLADLPSANPEYIANNSKEVLVLSKVLTLPKSQVGSQLRSLVLRHRQEWLHFLDRLGPHSWLTAQAGTRS